MASGPLLSGRRDPEVSQVRVRLLIKRGRTRGVVRVSLRDEDDHALAGAGEQNPVGVQQVPLSFKLGIGVNRVFLYFCSGIENYRITPLTPGPGFDS